MAILGYCRVSTDDQSITNQQMQIEEAGYNIAKWFTDEAVSGSVKASSEAVQTLISQGKTRLQIQEELGIS
ncbi:recombinase family protein, partial [Shigella sonnei]|uniref:recombinase family protein n=1 Tax=Shigella sonnei TaxID=624 RepID=UPI00148FCD5E